MKDTQVDDLFLPGFDFEEKVDLDMPESFEEATKAEVSEVLAAFRKRAKEEAAQKEKNTSTDFWFVVYFASQEQRDQFLSALNLIERLERDGVDFQYIDGQMLANAVGVPLAKERLTTPKAFRRPADIDDLVMEI